MEITLACCFEQIMEAALHKMTILWPLTSRVFMNNKEHIYIKIYLSFYPLICSHVGFHP